MDQGVVPARLKVLRPLCGVRYITPDGKAWVRLRAMLTPSLSPTRLEDLTAFGVAVDESLRDLPVDGLTRDLSPVLNESVRLKQISY